jgi:hypothetical protein
MDLRVRRRLVRSFFGRRRAALESLLVAPAMLRSGARHFGALRHDPADLARVTGQLARLYLTPGGTF